MRNDDKYIENIFLQIHNKLQDVQNYLFTNSYVDLNDSLNSTINYNNANSLLQNENTTISNNNNNGSSFYEQAFNENLNVIQNNLANSNYLNDDNDLYIIENSFNLNKKRIGQMPRIHSFNSPGQKRYY